MNDEICIASGQAAGTEWDGRTFAALAICVHADTPEEAQAKVRAFFDEATELAEAHHGVTVTTQVEELYATFRRAAEILEKVVVQTVRRIARDQ